MNGQEKRLVHVCNVDEADESAYYLNFLIWHFTCQKCKRQCRVNSGASQLTCGQCQTTYLIKSNGEVHRVELTASIVAATNPSKGGHTAVEPMKAGVGQFFASLAGAAAEMSETVQGQRLRDGLISTITQMRGLEKNVFALAMNRFIAKSQAVENEQENWSHAGRIKMGKELRVAAQKQFDFNLAESYALWLTGAWLESGSRNSEDALFVRETLQKLRLQIEG